MDIVDPSTSAAIALIAKVLTEEYVSSDRTRQLVQKIFCYHRLARVAFSTAVIAEEM